MVMSIQADTPQGRWVHRLGYAGLIPFVAGAALLYLVTEDVVPLVAIALTAYAAVIASFLGGIHWDWPCKPTTGSALFI